DGSTTAGAEAVAGYGGTITSDGNELSLISDADGSRFNINVDMTTTRTTFNPNYYPMLEIKYNLSDIGDNVLILVNCTTGVLTLQSYTTISDTTVRYNLLAKTAGGFYGFIFYGYSSQTLKIDYIKAYSIANYTYTGTGTSTDDVLYVSDDTLYCSGTSFTSIVLDQYPALSVDTDTYTVWNVTTSSGTPQVDFYVAAWAGYSSETRGTLASGTLTDIRLKFTASANIATIKFIDTHMWQEVGEAIIYFQVPIDQTGLNWWLIILGMCMVPASGVYFVLGGKDKMSMDKVFYCIVAFMLGWALIFIGVV
ncbi:MAG TPA: hypothetical protein VMW50_07005, partial [Dehalococcoidia bacterium]|nr:hypothetical protein [Dehalococcoidia bacterium]